MSKFDDLVSTFKKKTENKKNDFQAYYKFIEKFIKEFSNYLCGESENCEKNLGIISKEDVPEQLPNDEPKKNHFRPVGSALNSYIYYDSRENLYFFHLAVKLSETPRSSSIYADESVLESLPRQFVTAKIKLKRNGDLFNIILPNPSADELQIDFSEKEISRDSNTKHIFDTLFDYLKSNVGVNP